MIDIKHIYCDTCGKMIENTDEFFRGDTSVICEDCGLPTLDKHIDGYYYNREDDTREQLQYVRYYDSNNYYGAILDWLKDKQVKDYDALINEIMCAQRLNEMTFRRLISKGYITNESLMEMVRELDYYRFEMLYKEGLLDAKV